MVTLLLLCTFSAAAQIQSRNILSESVYPINGEAKLSIIHKFGTITIKNHKLDEIDLTVAANIIAEKQENVEKILNNISLRISGNEEGLSIETVFDDNLAGNKKNSATIDIIIQMPEYVDVTIDHKFGSTTIENIAGIANLSMAYGSINIQRLENSNKIKLLQGNLKAGFIAKATIKPEHSTLKIQQIEEGKIESVFSNIHCDNAGVLSMTTEGGNVEIGNIDQLRLTSNFTNTTIQNLGSLLNIQGEYSNIKLVAISDGFNILDIATKYSTLIMYFGAKPDFQLTGAMEFSKIDFPVNEWPNIKMKKEGQTIALEGNTGKGQATATVKIHSSFSNFIMK
jgi:hypothetical protein